VLGIAVRHGIVLIRRFEEDGGAGGEPGQALVRQVMGERLAPIVMTAATTALALLPFVIAGDVAGNEIAHSTAAVVLGGLATSTLLSLLVLPAVYVHFRRAAGEREGPAPAAPRVDVNA
jgi:Cu(I)/Ag(I) efflux system membrane protein CusA/SilA